MYSPSAKARLFFFLSQLKFPFKGSYLDFSHLTELQKIYITEMYMIKQYKSSITKNNKIEKNICSLKMLHILLSYF